MCFGGTMGKIINPAGAIVTPAIKRVLPDSLGKFVDPVGDFTKKTLMSNGASNDTASILSAGDSTDKTKLGT